MPENFKRPIQSIKIKNFLSFNKDGVDLELLNLNILIGPNGSGKSNFIDALRFWQTLSNHGKSSAQFFSEQGGIKNWIYCEEENIAEQTHIEIITSETSDRASQIPLKHEFCFGIKEENERATFELKQEKIECIHPEEGNQEPYFYYRFQKGHTEQAIINIQLNDKSSDSPYQQKKLSREYIDTDKSILLQKNDQELYPKLYALSQLYKRIKIYHSWCFGRNSSITKPQNLFQIAESVEENYSNFIAVVEKIKNDYRTRKKVENKMQSILPKFEYFDIERIDSEGRLYFIEKGGKKILANRISDGSFRFFVLLILLYSENKQKELICIEEPEMGLHPDAIPALAEALKEASQKKQIIITTHSEILVNCFNESPENIVVCNNEEGYTTMQRLESKDLEEWLKDYSLGELWSKGSLGGNLYG